MGLASKDMGINITGGFEKNEFNILQGMNMVKRKTIGGVHYLRHAESNVSMESVLM